MQFSFVKCIAKCFYDDASDYADNDDGDHHHTDDDNSTKLHHIAVICFVHKTSKSICSFNKRTQKKKNREKMESK